MLLLCFSDCFRTKPKICISGITQQKLCMDGRTVWNLAFVVAAGTVLVLSASEVPGMPRLWIVGYAMQCVLHMVFVCVEYRRQRRQQPVVASSVQDRIGSSSGNLSVSSREGSASASASAQYVSLGQLDDESTRANDQLELSEDDRSHVKKISVISHKYDLNSTAPFQTSDILDLHPIVKHSIPVSAEAKGLVETGKLQFAEVITIVLNCGPLHCGCNIKVLGFTKLNKNYTTYWLLVQCIGRLPIAAGMSVVSVSVSSIVEQHLAWNKDTQRWKVSSMLPSDLCNQYKIGPKITGMKDIRGEGSDCTIWYGDLLDIRLIPEAGQDRYIRLAVSETEIIIRVKGKNNESQQEDFELPLFDFA
ncbi:hypothetical protein JHK87_024354 [Glycine soja]|nr:hypothetical protein JHK87_024354 [Glycine soja]